MYAWATVPPPGVLAQLWHLKCSIFASSTFSSFGNWRTGLPDQCVYVCSGEMYPSPLLLLGIRHCLPCYSVESWCNSPLTDGPRFSHVSDRMFTIVHLSHVAVCFYWCSPRPGCVFLKVACWCLHFCCDGHLWTLQRFMFYVVNVFLLSTTQKARYLETHHGGRMVYQLVCS